MEVIKGWSWVSFGIYILISVLTAVTFRMSVKAKNDNKTIKIKNMNVKVKYLYYIFIYLIFIVFSCFRYIGPEIGGSDTLTYIDYFNKFGYTHFDIKETLIFNGYEYLFYNLMFVVKLLNGNFRVFLFIVNSIMIISLIFFVDRQINDEKKCIWLVLAYLPLIKSLNILRICIASFLGYISIYFLNENKFKASIIFAILAYLNHYLAIILLLLILFYKVFPNRVLYSKKRMLILNVTCIIISIIILPFIKTILLSTGFSNYVYKIKVSIWGYIPYILLYVLMILNNGFLDYIKGCNHLGYYKILSFLSLILPMLIIVNAAGRILLLFELTFILIAADLTEYFRSYVPKKYVKLYAIFILLFIIGYYMFKICRLWDGYCLMPYYNILFVR